MTRAPGRLIVLIRPPSLEPSTPDVREPREWITGRLGYRLACLDGRDHRLHGALVAEPARVEDEVVVRGMVAVVAVHLPDVGRPVLVAVLEALARLLFSDSEALHDDLHADVLRRAQEDMDRV